MYSRDFHSLNKLNSYINKAVILFHLNYQKLIVLETHNYHIILKKYN